MTVRTWVARAISEGGSIKWIVGIAIKLIFEVFAGALLGILTAILLRIVAPLDTIQLIVGVDTWIAAWIVISLGIITKYVHCTFDSENQ